MKNKLPVHVAIIMDGNGRWAKERGLPRIIGHKVGAESVREIIRTAKEIGIKLAVEPNVLEYRNLIGKNGSPFLLTKKEEIINFLNKINSKNLGLLLDVGHIQVSANSLNFNRDDFFDSLLHRTFEIHLHDNKGVKDLHLGLSKESWGLTKIKNCKDIPITLESHNLTIEQIIKNIDLIEESLKDN